MIKFLITAFALTAQMTFADTSKLVNNISSYDCERTLDVLLKKNAEAYRLSNAATGRLMYDEQDRMGLKLKELAKAQQEQSEAVRALLVKKCFKN